MSTSHQPYSAEADTAFRAFLAADPAAAGTYLGTLALKVRELLAETPGDGLDYALHTAVALTDVPAGLDPDAGVSRVERDAVAVLLADDQPWTYETVRAELDAKLAQVGVGTFRSRYTLSAPELYVLAAPHLSDAERALCETVLRSTLARGLAEGDRRRLPPSYGRADGPDRRRS